MDPGKIPELNRERLDPELSPVLRVQRTLVIGYKRDIEALAGGEMPFEDSQWRLEMLETV
jgi:hypothetical protein